MPLRSRVNAALSAAISRAQGEGRPDVPGQLARALSYATTPGGARIRPTILYSVALACEEDRPDITDAAAVALELMHCASLVHDDLPCFDDADVRRGKPSVHRAYSEPLAVLTGDSLIVAAFSELANATHAEPARGLGLIRILSNWSGMPNGICAGQAWESEAAIDLSAYHQSKTAALFVAATQMGALSTGGDPDHWTELGLRIGEAFQVADDLRDALGDAETLGKPVGQDERHDRPNAVSELGVKGAVDRLNNILGGAIASIPSCPGEARLAAIVRAQADALVPSAALVRAK